MFGRASISHLQELATSREAQACCSTTQVGGMICITTTGHSYAVLLSVTQDGKGHWRSQKLARPGTSTEDAPGCCREHVQFCCPWPPQLRNPGGLGQPARASLTCIHAEHAGGQRLDQWRACMGCGRAVCSHVGSCRWAVMLVGASMQCPCQRASSPTQSSCGAATFTAPVT